MLRQVYVLVMFFFLFSRCLVEVPGRHFLLILVPKGAQRDQKEKPVLAWEREARLESSRTSRRSSHQDSNQNMRVASPSCGHRPRYARPRPRSPREVHVQGAMSETTKAERGQEVEKLVRICTKTYSKLLMVISKSL